MHQYDGSARSIFTAHLTDGDADAVDGVDEEIFPLDIGHLVAPGILQYCDAIESLSARFAAAQCVSFCETIPACDSGSPRRDDRLPYREQDMLIDTHLYIFTAGNRPLGASHAPHAG